MRLPFALATALFGLTATAVPGSAAPADAAATLPMNGDCISTQYLWADATCDALFQSYVAESMPASGPWSHRGLTFTLPDYGVGAQNVVKPSGQVVTLKGKPGHRYLHFLVSAQNSGGMRKGGPVVVKLANGKTHTTTLKTYDWAQEGSKAAITAKGQAPTRVPGVGGLLAEQLNFFLETVELPNSSGPVSVTLPTGADAADLQILALTVSAKPATKTSGPKFR